VGLELMIPVFERVKTFHVLDGAATLICDEIIEAGKNLIMRTSITLYSSPNITKMIKPRRSRWTGNVAGIGEK
jgi:hypothetical protein